MGKTREDVETAIGDPMSEKERKPDSTKSFPRKYLAGGILALATLSLVIGLSVGLSRNKNSESEPRKPPYEVAGQQAVKFAAFVSADGTVKSSPSQPLSYTMRAFGPKAIDTYEDCTAFDNDIYNAASMILSNAINREASLEIKWNGPYQPPPEIAYGAVPEMEMDGGGLAKQEPIMDSPAADTNNSPESTTSTGDSYGTNNQVKGVDEADVIKSNGKYVFAAYGDEIVVWDAASGDILSRTKHETPVDPPKEEPVIETKKIMADPWYVQKSRVETLLLHEDRLTAIISNGFMGDVMYGPGMSQNKNPVQALVYNISSIPSDGTPLDLILKEDLKGNFIEARSIENFAHIVTTSGLDTYWFLTNHVRRYNEAFWGLNSEEYLEKVKTFIKDKKLIEKFTQYTREKATVDGKCDHIMQLTLFQSSKSADTTIPGDAWTSGVANAYTEITTLDMSASSANSSRRLSTPMSVTGAFLPNAYGTKVYASKNNLVLATPGLSFTQSWDESTYLMAFALSNDGTPAKGHSTGTVPGYMLNQFSMDEWNGHLRVATTVRSKFDCVAEEQTTKAEAQPEPVFNTRSCVWKMVEDSDNMINILDISSNDMEVVGSIKGLGHEGESIFAVRFMKEKAFMVTFRQTDPFYTFDLSDHKTPKQLGELKISGFSNYLHPYDAAGSVMIAVGQEADPNTGRPTGLQISLYDVSDLSNPSRIDKFDVIADGGGSSYSDAQHEHKAFRFYEQTKKLILPASIRNKNYQTILDGFKVYNIDKTSGISFHFDVNYKVDQYCWKHSNLPVRSMVHQGILTTMKFQTIQAHNIETKVSKWTKTLDDNNDCN